MTKQLVLTSQDQGHDQGIQNGTDETGQTFKMLSPSFPSQKGNITPSKGTAEKKS